MSRVQTVVLSVIAAALLAGVAYLITRRVTTDESSKEIVGAGLVDPGFLLFRTPRQTYGPGTIFRVDTAGQLTIVSDTLSRLMSARYGDEGIAQFTTNRRYSLDFGLFLDFIGGAGLATHLRDTTTLSFALGGAEREYVPEDDFDRAVDEYQKGRFGATTLAPDVVITAAKLRPGSRYFMIRETIRADSVNWTVGAEFIARAGLDGAKLAEQLRLRDTAVLAINRGQSLTLSQRFPNRMRVFYRPEAITVLAAGDSSVWKLDTTRVRLLVSPVVPLPPVGDTVAVATVARAVTTQRTISRTITSPWQDSIRARVTSVEDAPGSVRLIVNLPTISGTRIERLNVVNQEWASDARLVRRSAAVAAIDLPSRWAPNVRQSIRNNQVELIAAGTIDRIVSNVVSAVDTVRIRSPLVAGSRWTVDVPAGAPAVLLVVDGGQGRSFELDPTEVIENDYLRRVGRVVLPNQAIRFTFEVKAVAR